MARVIYSERQIMDFIELAQMKGMAPAMRDLGYPTYPTAQKWFTDRGFELPSIDSLVVQANELKLFYNDTTKKAALQIAIDRISGMIQENAGLTADDMNKLANALAKLLQTFQLIEGKSTSVTEKIEKSDTDKNIERLMTQMDKINAKKESEIG